MNRQMFGRRSEKLAPFDHNQPSLFEPIVPIKVEEAVTTPEIYVPFYLQVQQFLHLEFKIYESTLVSH